VAGAWSWPHTSI